MKQLLMSSLGVLILTGCAATYKAPTEKSDSFSTTHNSNKKAILASAKRVLLLEGFQIQSTEEQAGFISTSMKNWRLSPEEASCGTTMGIDYLKDNRTKTEIAINVIVDNKSLTIRSSIQGEYKPGAVDQDITLTCISKGIIEKDLGNKIVQQDVASKKR